MGLRKSKSDKGPVKGESALNPCTQFIVRCGFFFEHLNNLIVFLIPGNGSTCWIVWSSNFGIQVKLSLALAFRQHLIYFASSSAAPRFCCGRLSPQLRDLLFEMSDWSFCLRLLRIGAEIYQTSGNVLKLETWRNDGKYAFRKTETTTTYSICYKTGGGSSTRPDV